jgi:hypothetical protein
LVLVGTSLDPEEFIENSLGIHWEFIAVWLDMDDILLIARIYKGREKHGGYREEPRRPPRPG